MESTPQSNPWATPVAIIIAGALIAASLYFVQSNNQSGAGIELPQPGAAEDVERTPIAGVQADDYIRGSADADLVIVEYSDTECPFCNRFHNTMKQVMNEFGDSGKVAWVYRQFPLDSLHAKARPEAIALECAGELGGNDAFWAYADMIYEATPGNDSLDLNRLPDFAVEVGLAEDAFSACLQREDIAQRVEDDVQEAIESGGRGTPYSIILYKDEQLEIPGALPFDGQGGMKDIIEQVLAQ